MNQFEGFIKAYQVITTGKRHKYYKHTVELAKNYYTLSTGDGMDAKLRQMSSRESNEAFAERKKITIHIISSIISNLTHIYNRVPRSNGVRLKWWMDDKSRAADFQKILDNYSKRGFSNYFENRLKTLIELDPNAWLLSDFEGTDGSDYALPYPKEIYSENALMYEHKNATLLYLVTGPATEVGVKEPQYIVYTSEGAVIIDRIKDNKNFREIQNIDLLTGIPENFNYQSKSYTVTVPAPYNLSHVPAYDVGYIMDKKTAGQTYVNMYDACVPFFEKMIKVNSEQDVSMAKHVHMQKIQYVRKCTNVNGGCHCGDDGVYYTDIDDSTRCNVCSGRGFVDITTGGMEVIYLPLPESKDDILELDNIVKYIGVPIDTPKWQTEYIDHLTEICKQVMYNSDIFGRDEISDTATAKIIEMENVYDTLYPYAVNYARLWSETLYTISEIVDMRDELKVVASANKDFKLLSKTELLTLLQTATTAGASETIIQAINDEIAFSFYGDTDKYKAYEMVSKMLPFQNKSKEQQMLAVSMLSEQNPYYVSFVYGHDILKKLSTQYIDFYEMNAERQKQLFDAEVNAVIEKTKSAPKQQTFTGLI